MITERVMAAGSWTLSLSPETPGRVLEAINVEGVAGFGQLVILPAWLDPRAHTDATLLGLARWSGIYRTQDGPGGRTLHGAGASILLGDEDGKGDIREATVSTSNGWLTQWVPAVRPQALLAGTVDSPGGSYTGTFYLKNALEILEILCDAFNEPIEWRIRPNFQFDVGRASTGPAPLYNPNPRLVILQGEGDGGRDVNLTGVRGDPEWSRDLEDYSTKIVYQTGTEDAPIVNTATTPEAQIPYGRAGDGGPIVLDRLIQETGENGGSPSQMAATHLGRFNHPRRELLTASNPDIGHVSPVGSPVWLYAPPYVMDLSNPIVFGGRTVYPVRSRLVGMTWPVRRGYGVYLRVHAPGRLDWHDLTPHVEWETGQTRLEVGALPRPVTTH